MSLLPCPQKVQKRRWWIRSTGRWPCTTWSRGFPPSSSSLPCHHPTKVQTSPRQRKALKADQKRFSEFWTRRVWPARAPALKRWWSTSGSKLLANPESKETISSGTYLKRSPDILKGTVKCPRTNSFQSRVFQMPTLSFYIDLNCSWTNASLGPAPQILYILLCCFAKNLNQQFSCTRDLMHLYQIIYWVALLKIQLRLAMQLYQRLEHSSWPLKCGGWQW